VNEHSCHLHYDHEEDKDFCCFCNFGAYCSTYQAYREKGMTPPIYDKIYFDALRVMDGDDD
jgi:hypothetical protein